jgi:hypothetical protein
VPLFVQGVQGGVPRDVALVSAAISVAWTFGSLASSQLLLHVGLRSAAILGMAAISVGGWGLTRLWPDVSLHWVFATVVVLGLGLGTTSTALMVVVQTAVGWEQRGVATATQHFFRAIGGTLWVSVQGAALSAAATAGLLAAGLPLTTEGPLRIGELNAILDPALRATLSSEQASLLVGALDAGLHQVFVLLFGLALAGLVIVAFLPGRVLNASQSTRGGVAPV